MILINGERYRPDKFYAGEFKTERVLQEGDKIEWNYQPEDMCEDFMLLLLLNREVGDKDMVTVICDYVPYLRSHHSNDKEFAGESIYGDLYNLSFVAKYPQHSDGYVFWENTEKKYDRTKRYIALDKSEYERSNKSEMYGYFEKKRVDGKIVSYQLWDTRPLEETLVGDTLEGKSVVLIDDLIGYGSTAQKACDILLEQGVRSIEIQVDFAEDLYLQNPYFEEHNIKIKYNKLIRGL